ncbi:MAG: CopG family transcriptional regulator [Pseudomonadota bacterium]
MTSSLHVSLPDEMRAYVDIRTNGSKDYSTPSEYVRALIRSDMERDAQKLYVFKELLKSNDEISNNIFVPLSILDEIETQIAAEKL